MKKPLIQIGEEVREMTDDEFIQYKADHAKAETDRLAKETENVAKAKAKAELLDRLGITEEEAKLLLA
jgi:hypothetical protein